eukprot:SM000398S15212  [mRNA]  locus=s398:31142:32738:- [translate_table: standard]
MLVRSFAGPDEGDGDADAEDGFYPDGKAGGGDSERSRSWGNGPLRADDHGAGGAALPWSGPSLAGAGGGPLPCFSTSSGRGRRCSGPPLILGPRRTPAVALPQQAGLLKELRRLATRSYMPSCCAAAASVEGGEAPQSGQPSAPEAWSLGRSVAVLEGASLAVAVTAHAACQRAARRQLVEAVGSTAVERKHPAQVLGWLTTLQVLPLWIAVGANALLRLHSELLSSTGQGSPQPGTGLGLEMPLRERVGVLEVELVNTMKMGRALSRQLEKLSTRFRVTRMTLRDSLDEVSHRAASRPRVLSRAAERGQNELEVAQKLQYYVRQIANSTSMLGKREADGSLVLIDSWRRSWTGKPRSQTRQTAKLAQRTSNSAEGLAAGSELLNSELQELQFAMLAMQEQHSKHLKLFSSTAARLLQSQRSVEQKLRDLKS